MMKNKFPIKSASFHLPSREIQANNKYFINFNCTNAMQVSFLSTASFLVTMFVKSERALLDKHESTDVKIFDKNH